MAKIIRGFLSASELAFLRELRLGVLPWEPGRRITKYWRTALPDGVSGMQARAIAEMNWTVGEVHDCYLLRYDPNGSIDPHVDQNQGGEHHRLNALVEAPEAGGEFRIDGKPVDLSRPGDAVIFRPDLERHEVTRIAAGCRVIFSVGLLRRPPAARWPVRDLFAPEEDG